MKKNDEDLPGKMFIVGTMLFVGIVIIIFGVVQIAQRQILPGSLIITIGVFDLLMIPFVKKYLL